METVQTFKMLIHDAQALLEDFLRLTQTVLRLVRFVTEEVGSPNSGQRPLLLGVISD